jgi:hypothetical protein
MQAYKPQEVAAMLWGFATLGHTPLRLLYTARPDWRWRRSKLKAGESGKQHGTLRDYQPGQLASLAWSLAVMRQVRGPAGGGGAAPGRAWRGVAMCRRAGMQACRRAGVQACGCTGGRLPWPVGWGARRRRNTGRGGSSHQAQPRRRSRSGAGASRQLPAAGP